MARIGVNMDGTAGGIGAGMQQGGVQNRGAPNGAAPHGPAEPAPPSTETHGGHLPASSLLFGHDAPELHALPAGGGEPAPAPPVVTARLHQVRRLISHANDLLRLAAELENRGDPAMISARASRRAGPAADAAGDDLRWLDHARRAYRTRRIRGAVLGDETLFGEPAWDILLDLFIAAKEGKRVPVTSACIGAAVPTTTALRWLAMLEDRGLVVREGDPADARRVFVRLSADAYARMVAYFARAAGVDGHDPLDSEGG